MSSTEEFCILLVDPESGVNEATAKRLQEYGIRAHTAGNVEASKTVVRNYSLDCLVLVIRTGHEEKILTFADEMKKEMPVVVCASTGRIVGETTHLQPPNRTQTLAEKIREAVQAHNKK